MPAADELFRQPDTKPLTNLLRYNIKMKLMINHSTYEQMLCTLDLQIDWADGIMCWKLRDDKINYVCGYSMNLIVAPNSAFVSHI